MQELAWIPVALGAAAVVAGLGSRRSGGLVIALTAVAGVAAAVALRDRRSGRETAGAAFGEPEVERSITIGKTPEELYERWSDPKTLPQIMAGFATVRAAGDGRLQWKVEGPLGRTYE